MRVLNGVKGMQITCSVMWMKAAILLLLLLAFEIWKLLVPTHTHTHPQLYVCTYIFTCMIYGKTSILAYDYLYEFKLKQVCVEHNCMLNPIGKEFLTRKTIWVLLFDSEHSYGFLHSSTNVPPSNRRKLSPLIPQVDVFWKYYCLEEIVKFSFVAYTLGLPDSYRYSF